MPIPAIAPSTPIVINETYNGYYMTSLVVDASSGPLGNADAYMTLIPYNGDTGVMAPSSMELRVPVLQIFTRIANGEKDLAAIMKQILAYAEKTAKIQGVIS